MYEALRKIYDKVQATGEVVLNMSEDVGLSSDTIDSLKKEGFISLTDKGPGMYFVHAKALGVAEALSKNL